MDSEKTGRLILKLRKEKHMTQSELADILGVSDKTVSKWERGQGIPDVSLLMGLSEFFKVKIEDILAGESKECVDNAGNIKKAKYYVCPICKNITVCTGDAEVSCCGRKLEAALPVKADEAHEINVSAVEDDWYIITAHPMEKDHYLMFVAFVTGDRLQFIKQYPEWDMQVRIKKRGHGILLWYCNRHGLFYMML